MRSGIWLAEAITALAVLPDDCDWAAVLAMLGMTDAMAAEVFHGPGEADPELPPVGEDIDDGSLVESSPEVEPDLDELPLLEPSNEIVEPGDGLTAPWTLARYNPEARRKLPLQPLLDPATESGILRALLSARRREGMVDVAALCETVARGLPVTGIPRLPAPTLRFGVQLLVDRGLGMQPFRRDQDALVARVRSVVGSGLVDVETFSDIPQRGMGPGRRSGPYRVPSAGTAVLVLSDLGLGGTSDFGLDRGGREEWEWFAKLVIEFGCRLVFLTPYPEQRWASWMAGFRLVHWDRRTTVSSVVKAW